MKAGIETLDEVEAHYGPIVGRAATQLAAVSTADTKLEDIVDPIVWVIEETMTTLGFVFERKEGF